MIDKAVRLYEFLKSLVSLRTSVTLNVNDYEDIVWIYEIPRDKYCHCVNWELSNDETDSCWIEVKRPALPKIPPLPEICKEWVDFNTLEKYDGTPVLRERIIREVPVLEEQAEPLPTENKELKDFPEVQHIWENYVNKEWKVWAEEYGRLKKVQDIYGLMFNMYQQQKALGESYEVVIGLGLLKCNTLEGANIYRHLLYAQTELIFEPNRGTLILRASPEGAKLHFETEMLDPSGRPPVEVQLNLETELLTVSNDIWNKSVIHPIIRSWVNAISSKSRYDETDMPPSGQDKQEGPVAAFAPAIILRKRTNIGLIKFYEKIIDQIKTTGHIPDAIRVFLDIEEPNKLVSPSTGEDISEDKPGKLLQEPEEIYFPLPYNDEQYRIVREIQGRRGVIVQGPPGTGKSHTIANLISHFLASGRRVLVTSQTSRALKVLKAKIPEQIRPLCVSILGNTQEEFDNLRMHVDKITKEYYAWDSETFQNRITKLRKELYDLQKRFQETKVLLRELRENETYEHSIIDGELSGTAQSIGVKLRELEGLYGWVQEDITYEDKPPLTNEEFKRLIAISRSLNGEYSKELALKRIKSSVIFSPEAFVRIIQSEATFKEKDKKIRSDISLFALYDKLKRISIEERQHLLDSLRALERSINEACRRPLPWLKDAVTSILGEQDQPVKELSKVTARYLEKMQEKATISDDCHVNIPKELDLIKVKADADDLLQFLNEGKKLGWGIFRPKIYKRIKYLLKSVYVNGRLCDNSSCLRILVNYIETVIGVGKLREAWQNRIKVPDGTYSNQISFFSEQLEALNEVLAIEKPFIEAKNCFKNYKDINMPSWHNENEVNSFIVALEASFLVDELVGITDKINEINIFLKTFIADMGSHPINKELLDSLEKRDWVKWGEAYNRLVKYEKDLQAQEEKLNLLERLKTKAPGVAEAITNNPVETEWDNRAEKFEKAWSWLRAESWFREYEEKHDEYRINKDYEFLDQEIRKKTAILTSILAWDKCFQAMTEEQRMHLVAWSKAIEKIGKGTGKWAEKNRRDAEKNMEKCRGAIPAWVMPLYRVVETIGPQPEIFDVVIIDEASQCGSEALLLQYIAKKCIVVGDDQQISPEDVGIKRNEVNLLVERFLYDFPVCESFGLGNSLFTHAEIRYGSRIVLREHFRCVPEIIGFSNSLCYLPAGTSLEPLRAYPCDRLKPICTKYIKEGYREGMGQKVRNRPEAEQLVEQIVECCNDPKYANKTIGVITLQGDIQARYIEQLLVEKLGPEEIEKREIICGDAYDFQGDERDVIFLSMVAAPNERIGSLSRDTDKRRFNVAFSRAKDQIWLFHSVTLNDLSNGDYRYKLLSYCLDPSSNPMPIEEEVFESQFEKDVYERIVARGFNVVPQFKVADFRIDLVIFGTKFAIECDGDKWHGPEQYDRDQWRQRMLERLGWKFWRVRGSSFYHDPEQALEPLWSLLDAFNNKGQTQAKDAASYNSVPPPAEEQYYEKTTKDKGEKEVTEKKVDLRNKSIQKELFDDGEEDRLARIAEYGRKLYSVSTDQTTVLRNDIIKNTILSLLKQSSIGKDILGDRVLRELNITCRGANRNKYRRRILRVLTDLRQLGLIEEYDTDKRTRVRMSPDKY